MRYVKKTLKKILLGRAGLFVLPGAALLGTVAVKRYRKNKVVQGRVYTPRPQRMPLTEELSSPIQVIYEAEAASPQHKEQRAPKGSLAPLPKSKKKTVRGKRKKEKSKHPTRWVNKKGKACWVDTWGNLHEAGEYGERCVASSSRDTRDHFYLARVRKNQTVAPGRAIQFVLEAPIPSLNLAKGTILRGIPKLEEQRISLEVSSAVSGDRIRRLRLLVFDKSDCQPGLYLDSLSQKIEETGKQALVDGAANALDSRSAQLVREGARLLEQKHKLTLPAGKELLVGIPPKEPNT